MKQTEKKKKKKKKQIFVVMDLKYPQEGPSGAYKTFELAEKAINDFVTEWSRKERSTEYTRNDFRIDHVYVNRPMFCLLGDYDFSL